MIAIEIRVPEMVTFGYLEMVTLRGCACQLVLKLTLQPSLQIMGRAAVHVTGQCSRDRLRL